jgi:choline dehydrogenase-like flavoprotein
VILDFARGDTPAHLDTDLCIVGAGAAGIALALEFANTRISVVLLESGGERPESDTQRLYDAELRGLPCATVHDGRARVFGGTTTMWAGQAMKLSETDFAARDWLADSGWPLSLTQLESYYRRAERLMRLPESTYDERGWPAALPMPPSAHGIERRFSTFTPAPNFAGAHRDELARAANVTVLLHANATRLSMGEDGAGVDRIQLASLSGRSGWVRARRYVICCGGVETPRLLLASKGPRTRGVGNERDLVGRFFQEHVHLKLPVAGADRRALARLFHGRRLSGVRHFAKLSATDALQRDERILNVGADLCYDPDANVALRAVRELRGAARDRRPARAVRSALTAARHPRQLSAAGYRRGVLRQKASEGFGPIYFCLQTEAVARRESRVTLYHRVDALGMPRAIVDWRIGASEVRTATVFAGRLDALLRGAGLGRLELSELPGADDLEGRVAGGCHHIGTTRMATDAQAGVVDRDCRVFGVRNLFIAGSAVFPTSGWGNPTLTLLALGYRLADQLKSELDGAAPQAADRRLAEAAAG